MTKSPKILLRIYIVFNLQNIAGFKYLLWPQGWVKSVLLKMYINWDDNSSNIEVIKTFTTLCLQCCLRVGEMQSAWLVNKQLCGWQSYIIEPAVFSGHPVGNNWRVEKTQKYLNTWAEIWRQKTLGLAPQEKGVTASIKYRKVPRHLRHVNYGLSQTNAMLVAECLSITKRPKLVFKITQSAPASSSVLRQIHTCECEGGLALSFNSYFCVLLYYCILALLAFFSF